MSKGAPSLAFVPVGSPVTKVKIAGKDEPATTEESPFWLPRPAGGPAPVTVTALSQLSSSHAAGAKPSKEQRIIQTLVDMVRKMSGKGARRTLRPKRKPKRSLPKPAKRSITSLVVKALSPPLHLKSCRHRVPLGYQGLRLMKPDWALFRKLASSGAEGSGAGEGAAKKRPLHGKNPSLEVRSLSPCVDPDSPGARALVATDACSSTSGCTFTASGRYKPLIVNSNQKKKRKLGSKSSKSRKLKRRSKVKAIELQLQSPYSANKSKVASHRIRPYKSMCTYC